MVNRLADEKSPYLLQHKNNPVDWYPWVDEAFNRARQEEKPVFLSIGYSTCHWCHVMEKESFEDEEVAEVLNSGFVSVKVDREERPDIDHVYMSFCQAITGQGGWPLTIIMTPEKKPFFAATYLPRDARWGRAGLLEILDRIRRLWEQEREMVLETGDKMAYSLVAQQKGKSGDPELQTVDSAYQALEKSFDSRYGGFWGAPKFPTPHKIMFLLRYWKRTGSGQALVMAEKTLQAMYSGGIYDHVGFGFARYSTDKMWLAPHFEKMLYDNALLAMVYTEAFLATGRPLYRRVAQEIFTYVLGSMTSPEGGFYSAEDADSEGEEGKFYTWSPEEVKSILGPVEGDFFCSIYDITEKGNFEGESIPNLINAPPIASGDRERLEQCRQKLYLHRGKRVHPYRDEKVLTSWNGLMIAALAKGAAAFDREDYLQAAESAASFIIDRLRRPDGRLLARYRDGDAAFPGYLDDYAFLQWGFLELYRASFKPDYLKEALTLLDQMKALFWDDQHGGFFFYGHDAEELLYRPKEFYDGAVPSGNSVAALNILHLGRMTGRDDLTQLAERQIRAFAGEVAGQPLAGTFFIMAVQEFFTSPVEIVIASDRGGGGLDRMIGALRGEFIPGALVVLNPQEEPGSGIEELSAVARGKVPLDGSATAYICCNNSCLEPVTDAGKMAAAISGCYAK